VIEDRSEERKSKALYSVAAIITLLLLKQHGLVLAHRFDRVHLT
jgi:hypothetical protein